MADINSPVEIGVTTGPIRGSRKVQIASPTGSGIRVAMREIDLDHGRYEVKALNPQGQSVKLYVNARSGAIEQVRHRSND